MQFLKARKLLIAAALMAGMDEAWAVIKTWSGGGSNWNTPSNWSPSGVPAAGDDLVFNSGATNVSLPGNVLASSIVFTSGYAGDFDFAGYTLVVDGGTADFRSGGTFVTSTSSALVIKGASTQILHPSASYALPYLSFSFTPSVQFVRMALQPCSPIRPIPNPESLWA